MSSGDSAFILGRHIRSTGSLGFRARKEVDSNPRETGRPSCPCIRGTGFGFWTRCVCATKTVTCRRQEAPLPWAGRSEAVGGNLGKSGSSVGQWQLAVQGLPHLAVPGSHWSIPCLMVTFQPNSVPRMWPGPSHIRRSAEAGTLLRPRKICRV